MSDWNSLASGCVAIFLCPALTFADEIEFNWGIHLILSDHCFTCPDPDAAN